MTRDGVLISAMCTLSPWSESEAGMSFTAWFQKVMKFNEEFTPHVLETWFGMERGATLDMEQDHEVVVALGTRA